MSIYLITSKCSVKALVLPSWIEFEWPVLWLSSTLILLSRSSSTASYVCHIFQLQALAPVCRILGTYLLCVFQVLFSPAVQVIIWEILAQLTGMCLSCTSKLDFGNIISHGVFFMMPNM